MSDVHSSLAGSDDYGWSDAGWHNPTDDLRTPTLNALVATGIEFDRHYVFKCESVLYRGMATQQGAFHNVLVWFDRLRSDSVSDPVWACT
eukprot:COSAG02_NODE_49939_length_323_cov_1.375000_1_plen_89_part_01